MQSSILGIEITRSQISAGIVSPDGSCQRQVQAPIKDSVGPQMESLVEGLMQQSSVVSVGISDLYAHLHANWAEHFSKKWGVPVFHTHPGHAAALAERHFGPCKDLTDFLAISIENDALCGIVSGGEWMPGQHGGAGQLGQMQVAFNGQYDRLLEHLSEEGIKRAALRVMADFPQMASPLRDETFHSLTAAKIAAAGKQKDKLALQVFELLGGLLGLKLSDAIAYFSPQAIILSCSTPFLGDMLLHPTAMHTHKNTLAIFQGKTQILLSELPSECAAVMRGGAVALASQPKAAVSA